MPPRIAHVNARVQPGTPIQATGAKSSVSVAPGGEVLLTAGAIHSPHLLLASGIGPKDQLSGFNIDSVADLSGVGENLQARMISLFNKVLPWYKSFPLRRCRITCLTCIEPPGNSSRRCLG